MSNRKKNHRRAQQRRHQRTGASFGGPPGPGSRSRFGGRSQADVESAMIVVETAATHHIRQNLTEVGKITDELVDGQLGSQQRVVDTAIVQVLRAQIAHLWAHGWLPVDVYQMAHRNRSDLAATLAVDMIADNAAQHSGAAIHPRWRGQLDELEAKQWWDQGRPHASQWAERHGLDRHSAVHVAIELVALFMTMGQLPVIVPPPGQSTAASPHDHHQGSAVDEKILGKVRALLAKAEATDYPDEAEALSAKAQELMTRYSIERATAEAHTESPMASACRIWLDPPYIGAKSLLIAAVASANHCRTVSYEKIGFVTVLGDDVDLEVVGLLSTSIMVQATRAMLSAGRRVAYSGKSRTRSFRQSFLIAYATRIGERLRDATDEAVAAAGKELVPVFAQREQAVDDLFQSLFADRVVHRSFSVGNAEGYGAGRAAADQAVLNTQRRAVPQH